MRRFPSCWPSRAHHSVTRGVRARLLTQRALAGAYDWNMHAVTRNAPRMRAGVHKACVLVIECPPPGGR
jgi:hypothetical protein